MCRDCKSVSGHADCSSIVLERTTPCPSSTARRHSDGTAAQSGGHTPARESQGYAARPRRAHTLPGESPAAGQGTWTRPRGNQRHKLVSEHWQRRLGAGGEARGAATPRDQPASQTSGEEVRRAVEIRGSGVLVRKSNAASPSPHPQCIICRAVGCKLRGELHYLGLWGASGNRWSFE